MFFTEGQCSHFKVAGYIKGKLCLGTEIPSWNVGVSPYISSGLVLGGEGLADLFSFGSEPDSSSDWYSMRATEGKLPLLKRLSFLQGTLSSQHLPHWGLLLFRPLPVALKESAFFLCEVFKETAELDEKEVDIELQNIQFLTLARQRTLPSHCLSSAPSLSRG